jgi:hypothetical protein
VIHELYGINIFNASRVDVKHSNIPICAQVEILWNILWTF